MEETPPDGNLPAALDRLYASTAKLLDPIKDWTNDQMRVAPSLWQQLMDDIPARTGNEAAIGRFASSVAPAYLKALDLKREMDDTVRRWNRAGDSTPERLRQLASARWRPQDTALLERIADDLDRWAAAIDSIINPPAVKSVAAPCPACGTRTVYRHSGGEQVRQAALQVIATEGCRCLACNTVWPPELYLHLARVLGFDKPTGVVG